MVAHYKRHMIMKMHKHILYIYMMNIKFAYHWCMIDQQWQKQQRIMFRRSVFFLSHSSFFSFLFFVMKTSICPKCASCMKHPVLICLVFGEYKICMYRGYHYMQLHTATNINEKFTKCTYCRREAN